MNFDLKVTELSHDELVSIISGADSGISYWAASIWAASMDVDPGDYAKAKDELTEENFGEGICYEDVIARVLHKGKEIVIVDSESVQTEYKLDLNKLLTGVTKGITDYRLDFDPKEWDAADCDTVIQLAIFGELIYG